MSKHNTNTTWSKFRQSLGIAEDPDLDDLLTGGPQTPPPEKSPRKFAIPISSELVIVTCNACQTPILESAYLDHTAICTGGGAPKQPQQAAKTVPVVKASAAAAPTAAAGNGGGGGGAPEKPGKKRKRADAPDTAEPPPPKQPKVTKQGPKQKQPIDLDSQCGVPTDTQLCTRAITCKIHSKNAQRAVQGRSMPYDVLVQLYQEKKGLRQGPGQRGNAAAGANGRLGPNGKPLPPGTTYPTMENMTREDQVEAIFNGVKNSAPSPIATALPVAMWKRYKDQMALHSAFAAKA